MKKSILLLLVFTSIFSVNAQERGFTIKGKIVSCSENKVKSLGAYIYLYEDSIAVDSIRTYRSLPNILGGGEWVSGKFKFKDVKNGKYEIRSTSHFDEQEYPQIIVSGKNITSLKICSDKLPKKFYEKKTFLDELQNNDTLFINVYIASFGEFGGYDEGLWITKSNNQYAGRFYSLPSTYALQKDYNEISKVYFDKKSQVKPLTDTFLLDHKIVTEINCFLTEIEHYKDNSISNAPEHFLIFTKDKYIFKVKNNSRYKPYIQLKNKIESGR